MSTVVSQEPDAKPNKVKKKKRPQIEVCFVLDTTGSMSGLIQGAKDKIWSIANEMIAAKPTPRIKFGLIGYRDLQDKYVTQRFEMTSDVDEIHSKLMAFAADGGGDTPESVNQALLESVSDMDWSEDRKVLKIIFLVGDAPPHMDYDEIQYPEICKLAVRKDLIINTIQCGVIGGTQAIWKQIAHSTEGKYAAILQNGGTVTIRTPFDDQLALLNGTLNGTVCPYGDAEEQMKTNSKILSQVEADSEAIADRATFFSQNRFSASSGMAMGGAMGGSNCAISGADDLVEMIMDGEVEIDAIDPAKLPKDLQELSPEERTAELNKRIDARKKTIATIDDLVKKRSDFLEAEKAKLAKESETAEETPEGFDMQVKDMIREQAEKKGIEFEK
jgi:Mg-chelatase subunit ChlD